MFKRVDVDERVDGFRYYSKNAISEGVKLEEGYVVFVYTDTTNDLTTIYTEDIPKMIKALQSAYDYQTKAK